MPILLDRKSALRTCGFVCALGIAALGLTDVALAGEPAPPIVPIQAPSPPADPAVAAPGAFQLPPLGDRSIVPSSTNPRTDAADGGSGHFTAGAGFYFIRPYFANNPAFTATQPRVISTNSFSFGNNSFSSTNTSTSSTSSGPTDFNYGYEFAPQIWLGYVTDTGLGIRGRWWHFDQSSSLSVVHSVEEDFSVFDNSIPGTTTTTTGSRSISSSMPLGLGLKSQSPLAGTSNDPAQTVPPEVFLFQSNLKLDVYDLEVTQDMELGRWSLLFSGGIRYAHLSEDYDAFRSRAPYSISSSSSSPFFSSSSQNNSLQDADTLLSGHTFDGAGPVVATEMRRALGNSGFALFGSARGAVLFGESKQRAMLISIRNSNSQSSFTNFGFSSSSTSSTSAMTINDAASSRHDVIPTAELEGGLEYSRDLGRFHLFSQATLTGQVWLGGGNASQSAGVSPVAAESNFGFIGLSYRAGFTY